MGWLLGYKPPLDVELLDAAMLALGRALYLCSTFEDKCRLVLQVVNVEERIEERTTSGDPVDSLEELFSHLPNVKMLARIINELSAKADLLGMNDEDRGVLTRAKDARNFIAHNAKDLGPLNFVRREHVAEFIVKLRTAVAEVAVGDNFISKIIYRIEERGEPIPYIAVNYADLIDLWVFGHLIRRREPDLWSLLYHMGLPGVPHVPSREIYLPHAARRSPSLLPSLNKRLRVEPTSSGTPSKDDDNNS